MKTLIFITACILSFNLSYGQSKPDAQQVKTNTNSTTVKTLPTTSTQQPVQTTAVISPGNARKNPGQYFTPTTQGKDLRLIIRKVEDISIGAENNYYFHYTLINCGTESLDISNIELQGFFYTSDGSELPGGALVLSPMLLNNQTTLASGYSFEGKMGGSHSSLLSKMNYKYVLKADYKNKITEANENNNSAQSSVTGHAKPAKKQIINGDISVVIDSIVVPKVCAQCPGGYYIFYTIKNVGNNSVDIKNHYSIQSYVRSYASTDFAPSGGRQLALEGMILAPGQTMHASFRPNYGFESMKNYSIKISVLPRAGATENDVSNNTAEKWLTIQ